MLSALGQVLPFWDRDIDLLVMPRANGDQLNGLLAVLDRYAVTQIITADVSTDSRAGREWWALLTQKNHRPIELQSAGLDLDVPLSFDGAMPVIESGAQRLAIGSSEQAQINIIAGEIGRLPQQPQLIFALTPIVSDTRMIDLTNRGTIDLTLTTEGVTVNEVR